MFLLLVLLLIVGLLVEAITPPVPRTARSIHQPPQCHLGGLTHPPPGSGVRPPLIPACIRAC